MQPDFFDPDVDKRIARIASLAKLSACRRESVSDEDLELFERELSGFTPEDVAAACDRLATTEPKQFEPRFPTLATLIRECRISLERRTRPAPTPARLGPHISDLPKEKFDEFMRQIRVAIGREK